MKTSNIRIRISLLLLMLTFISSAWAQQNVVTGKVIEYFGGAQEPVVGANVVFVNSQNRYLNGAVTDLEGNFRIQVPAEKKSLSIRISYIGMKTQTIKYTGQKTLNVTLKEDDAQRLQEVVVSGRKVDQMGVSRIEQTSAVQTLQMAEIVDQTPVASVEEALQGQIAGLDITTVL